MCTAIYIPAILCVRIFLIFFAPYINVRLCGRAEMRQIRERSVLLRLHLPGRSAEAADEKTRPIRSRVVECLRAQSALQFTLLGIRIRIRLRIRTRSADADSVSVSVSIDDLLIVTITTRPGPALTITTI